MSRPDRGLQIAILLGTTSLVLTGIFVWFRLTSPSDGARFIYSVFAWKSEGVEVTPVGNSTDNLKDGDIIIAIDDRPMESWIEDVLRPRTWGGKSRLEQEVDYTILRGSDRVNIPVELREFPLREILAAYWGPLLFAFVTQIIATLVLVRRPHEKVAQVLFIWAWSGSHTYAWSLGQQAIDITNGFIFWLYFLFTPLLWLLYWSSALHLAFIFPQENRLVKKFPKIVPTIYLGAYASFLIYTAGSWTQASNLMEWMRGWTTFPNLITLLYLALMVIFLLWGYKNLSEPAARQKVRWVVYGGLVSGGGGLILWILPPILIGRAIISANTLGVLTLPFPVTLAIAIHRHQLFDIDLLINRTLVYGLLSGTLAILYFSSVVLLQSLFRAIIGENSQIAIVASTLGIATMFSPLRKGVQNFIDRRFYRHKYDAEKTLAAFASTLRDETDLSSLKNALVQVVKATMQPTDVYLWIHEPRENKTESIQG
jgi:hypothetical protein